MARHPWVAQADERVRWSVQMVLGADGLGRLTETARLVEQLGIDGFYIFDHPTLQADPWTCLSAVAAVTSRVDLGSVVNCVPYRHPAMLARLAADVDNLSNGRFVLGLGIGWLVPEFAALGAAHTPHADRFAALEEAWAIIQGAWGPEKFAFHGEHYATEGLRVQPPPVRQPRPPLLIGGSGEQRSLRLVARLAEACNITEVEHTPAGMADAGGPAIIRHKLDVLRRHCEAEGRDPDEILRTHFRIKLVIAPTESAANAKLEHLLALPSTSPGTRRAQRSAFTVGTPDQVVRHYQALVDAGIQAFFAQVDSEDEETLHLLAAEVMPRVGYR